MLTPKDEKALLEYQKLLQKVRESNTVNPFESEREKQDRIARAKVDYNFFVNTYFKELAPHPCASFHLKAAKFIRRMRKSKCLFPWGRGLAKSTHFTVLTPLWLWINNDIKTMAIVGQTEDKAQILLRDLKVQFEGNPLFINDFGAQHNLGAWEKDKFITQNGFFCSAISIGGSPRGLKNGANRPDYIVVDDCDTKQVCRNPKRLRELYNWLKEDLMGTFSSNGSRYIQVNNIFAPVTLMTLMRDEGEDFYIDQVNAIDENGNPSWDYPGAKEFFESQRKAMGTLSFEAEYNNRPYVAGNVFKMEMLQWVTLPPMSKFDRIIATWDVAYSDNKSSDFNAVRVWGLYQNNFYLIDCFVRQCKMGDAIRWMYAYKASLKNEHRITFYFESQFWNEALQMVQNEIEREMGEPLTLVKSLAAKGNKFDRIMATHPYYQQGRIYYNAAHKAKADFQEGIGQLLGIEPGYKSHDDAPDADAAAIEMLSKHTIKKAAKFSSVQRTKRGF